MTTDAPGGDPLLRALAGLLAELADSSVLELEVSVGEARLYLRQRPGARPPAPERASAEPQDGGAPLEEEGLVAVAAPISGVFYASPSPDEPPYVQEGDEVEAGQVVALIEAMKVFNEIHAEVAGTVARVLVAAGHLVRAGQTLLLIRPHSPGSPEGDAGALEGAGAA